MSVGVAAHITAAAPGGPRYDACLTPQQRSAHANGIWLCQTCARWVDVENVTVAQLRLWKNGAEEAAARELGMPADATKRQLQLDMAEVDRADVNSSIGELLIRGGVREAWGSSEHGCVQDLLIELARNAFEHGGAHSVTILIDSATITIFDDGGAFDPVAGLNTVGVSGGRQALLNLSSSHQGDLLLSVRRFNEVNQLMVMKVEGLEDHRLLAPCTVLLDRSQLRRARLDNVLVDLAPLDGCGDVIVVLPKFSSLSDAFGAAFVLKEALTRRPSCRVSFIAPGIRRRSSCPSRGVSGRTRFAHKLTAIAPRAMALSGSVTWNVRRAERRVRTDEGPQGGDVRRFSSDRRAAHQAHHRGKAFAERARDMLTSVAAAIDEAKGVAEGRLGKG